MNKKDLDIIFKKQREKLHWDLEKIGKIFLKFLENHDNKFRESIKNQDKRFREHLETTLNKSNSEFLLTIKSFNNID